MDGFFNGVGGRGKPLPQAEIKAQRKKFEHKTEDLKKHPPESAKEAQKDGTVKEVNLKDFLDNKNGGNGGLLA